MYRNMYLYKKNLRMQAEIKRKTKTRGQVLSNSLRLFACVCIYVCMCM